MSEFEGWDPRVEDYRDHSSSTVQGSGPLLNYSRSPNLARNQDSVREARGLYVKNVPNYLTSDNLKCLFSEHGSVLSVFIGRPNSDLLAKNITWAIIKVASMRDALAMMSALNNKPPLNLRVELSITEEEKKRRRDEKRKEELLGQQMSELTTQPLRSINNSQTSPKVSGGVGRGKQIFSKASAGNVQVIGSPPQGMEEPEGRIMAVSNKSAPEEIAVNSPQQVATPVPECVTVESGLGVVMLPGVRRGSAMPCVFCGLPGKFRCGVCKAWYCSKSCQVDDWYYHHRLCSPPPALDDPSTPVTTSIAVAERSVTKFPFSTGEIPNVPSQHQPLAEKKPQMEATKPQGEATIHKNEPFSLQAPIISDKKPRMEAAIHKNDPISQQAPIVSDVKPQVQSGLYGEEITLGKLSKEESSPAGISATNSPRVIRKPVLPSSVPLRRPRSASETSGSTSVVGKNEMLSASGLQNNEMLRTSGLQKNKRTREESQSCEESLYNADALKTSPPAQDLIPRPLVVGSKLPVDQRLKTSNAADHGTKISPLTDQGNNVPLSDQKNTSSLIANQGTKGDSIFKIPPSSNIEYKSPASVNKENNMPPTAGKENEMPPNSLNNKSLSAGQINSPTLMSPIAMKPKSMLEMETPLQSILQSLPCLINILNLEGEYIGIITICESYKSFTVAVTCEGAEHVLANIDETMANAPADPNYKPEVGAMVGAFSPLHESWYRAFVHYSCPGGGYMVCYVDFGNMEEVTLVKPLPEGEFTDVPGLAMVAKILGDVRPDVQKVLETTIVENEFLFLRVTGKKSKALKVSMRSQNDSNIGVNYVLKPWYTVLPGIMKSSSPSESSCASSDEKTPMPTTFELNSLSKLGTPNGSPTPEIPTLDPARELVIAETTQDSTQSKPISSPSVGLSPSLKVSEEVYGGTQSQQKYWMRDLAQVEFGEECPVISVWLDEVNNLYIQPLDQQLWQQNEDMIALMNEHCQEAVSVSKLEVGELVCVFVEPDNTWYRAEMINVQESDGTTASFHFIDYGDTRVVDISQVRCFSGKLQSFPRFCKKIEVAGVHKDDTGAQQSLSLLVESQVVLTLRATDVEGRMQIYDAENMLLNTVIASEGEITAGSQNSASDTVVASGANVVATNQHSTTDKGVMSGENVVGTSLISTAVIPSGGNVHATSLNSVANRVMPSGANVDATNLISPVKISSGGENPAEAASGPLPVKPADDARPWHVIAEEEANKSPEKLPDATQPLGDKQVPPRPEIQGSSSPVVSGGQRTSEEERSSGLSPPQQFKDDMIVSGVPPMYEDHQTSKLATGKDVPVFVLEAMNPFCVFVVPQENLKAFETIDELSVRMNNYCDSQPPSLHRPIRGEMCLAKFSQDNKWYRAACLTPGMDSTTVIFVDYGNSEDVPYTLVRPTPPAFLTLPCLAVHCIMTGLDIGSMKEEAKDRMGELVPPNSHVTVNVISHNDDGTYYVDIPEVRETLVKEGLVNPE